MACGLWAVAWAGTGTVTVALWLLHFLSAGFDKPLDVAAAAAVVSMVGYLFARLRRVEHALLHHMHNDDGRIGILESDEELLRWLQKTHATTPKRQDGTR